MHLWQKLKGHIFWPQRSIFKIFAIPSRRHPYLSIPPGLISKIEKKFFRPETSGSCSVKKHFFRKKKIFVWRYSPKLSFKPSITKIGWVLQKLHSAQEIGDKQTDRQTNRRTKPLKSTQLLTYVPQTRSAAFAKLTQATRVKIMETTFTSVSQR